MKDIEYQWSVLGYRKGAREMNEGIRITEFGKWIVENHLDEYFNGSPETKKRLREQFKKEIEK